MIKHCIVCKKEFKVPPSLDRLKCCSKACSNISKRGRKLTDEHKAKLSKVAKEKRFGKWMTGKKDSYKTKIKKSKNAGCYWLGKKFSDEYKKKLSEAQKGKQGKNHSRWKGGRVKFNGYIYIKCYDHPNRTKQGYMPEHRLIMEKRIGRLLKKEEVVHHINGIKIDNRPENLKLFSNVSQHISHHHKSGTY